MRSRSNRYSTLDALCYAFVIVVVVLVAMLLVLGEAWRRKMVDASERKEAVMHCRQIIIGLRLYSGDRGSLYPTGLTDDTGKWLGDPPRSSNELFRELFKSGCLVDEVDFGCPRSPFHPDGKIGAVPACKEALKRGENHWAVVEGLGDTFSHTLPVVFENPTDASVPPRWDTDAAGKPKPGRCWADRTVCVGFNDATVRWIPLEPGSGWRELKEKVFPPEIYPGQPMRIFQVDE